MTTVIGQFDLKTALRISGRHGTPLAILDSARSSPHAKRLIFSQDTSLQVSVCSGPQHLVLDASGHRLRMPRSAPTAAYRPGAAIAGRGMAGDQHLERLARVAGPQADSLQPVTYAAL